MRRDSRCASVLTAGVLLVLVAASGSGGCEGAVLRQQPLTMTRLALSHSHHGRPASQHILDHERQQPRQQQNDRHTFHVAGGARGFAAQAQEQGPAAERQGAPSSHKHSAHRRVTYDYENPIEYGCHAYEADVRIDGIPGSFCSPSCSRTVPCSTNLPPDTTAAPECVLEFPGDTAPSMCALVCTPGANQCPLNASCKSISPGMGLCTYNT